MARGAVTNLKEVPVPFVTSSKANALPPAIAFMIQLPMQTPSLTGATCGVTMRWGSICAREWVSRESDAGQRKRLTSSTHPLVLPTCWLLVSWVTICFGPSASLLSSHSLALNGSYLKTKQSNDAFRQKEENWRGEKKVSAELRNRQADCEKKKIRRSKEKPELHS